jgi:hypothetical protein
MSAPSSASVLPLGRHPADHPPPQLRELANDTGASLAYTAAAGWHLLPDPELVARVIDLTDRTPKKRGGGLRRASPARRRSCPRWRSSTTGWTP